MEHVRGSVPDNANKYHPYYYQQGFTIPTSPTGTTIKPNESTYMRIRIVQGNSLSTSDANVTYKNLPGETEDFKVKFYGATRPSDICTDVSTNSPILLTDRYPTGMDMKNGYYQTLVFTTDVPSYSAPGGVYEDATITVSSSDALTSDGDKSTRALVSDMGGKYTPIENTILVEINQQGNANTIIDVKIRDSDGNPINLPLTFSFIGMDSEYYDSKPEHKHNVDAHPAEYIHFEEEDIFLGGLKLEDFSNTYITDGDLNYLQNLIISPTNGKYNIFDYHFGVSTQTAGMASPSSGLWLRSDQYAQSDIQFTTNGTSIKLLFGLNMENINIPINDCVDGFDPTATLRIIGDDTKYQDLEIYKNYPIEYVSDNIAVPYYENLNNFSFVAEIPDGVEFSDEANKVEVYKRPLVGREPTNDPWTKVDSSDYQLIETEASSEQKSRDILKVVELYFPNAIANDTIGYEYKFKLNIQVSDNYTNKNNGSSVEINDVLKVNSYVYYDKDDYTYLQTNLDPSEYQDENQLDEFYRFNESTITIRRPYELEMETYMGDPNMYITTDQEIADVLTYKYEYNNCKTCTSINEKTAFLSGEEANKYMINIPIADKKDVEFASSDPQDMYEDISISIYDGTYVVSTFNVRRYYPVDLDFEITNLDDIKKVDENLNPVEMYTHIVTGEKKWIEQYYAQEKIKLDSLSTYQNVVDGKLFVSLKPEIILNDVNAPSNWLNIDDTMMKPVTDAKVYAKNTRESVELLLPPELIDTTLSVPISVLNSIEYATIKFSSVEEIEVVDETKKTKYTQSLSSQYVIEEISGRLYNKLESTECGSNVCNLNVLYNVETDDISRINEGYNDMNDKDLVLTNLVSNVFLLARDLELLDRNFDYYIVVRDFGLNKVNLNIKSDFTYSGNMVSYKKNDGHQYFMRAEVSDDNCIQTYTCDSQYKEILSGEITSTQQVKNELLKDDNKMSNYFTNTQWLDFFIR